MDPNDAAALYDATITPVWRLAVCLHGPTPAAQTAVTGAYAAYTRSPGAGRATAREATRRLLALLQQQAPLRAGSAPEPPYLAPSG